MAGLPYLIPTARYKRAVKVGNKVTFKPEDTTTATNTVATTSGTTQSPQT